MTIGFNFAQLSWREGHPYSETFAEGYYSLHPRQQESGLAEVNHVFIEGTDLKARIKALPEQGQLCIAELGFGTGLNFYAAYELWQHYAKPGQHLTYITIEKTPLSPIDFRKTGHNYRQQWPELTEAIHALSPHYNHLIPGCQTIPLSDQTEHANITLQLLILDAYDALVNHRFSADIWFLDGFSPAKNAAMWSDAVIEKIAQKSQPGTTLATFSAAGQLKRALKKHGFHVQSPAGFAGKREMIAAIFTDSRKAPEAPIKSLLINRFNDLYNRSLKENHRATKPKALILGSGLSGAALAHFLKQTHDVSVWDPKLTYNCPEHAIAYSRHYSDQHPLAEWNRLSYQHFLSHIDIAAQHIPDLWHGIGLMQQYNNTQEIERWHKLKASHTLTAIADIFAQAPYRIHFPNTGWVNVPRLRSYYLQGIAVEQRAAQRFQQTANGWLVTDALEKTTAFDDIIIAAGTQTLNLLERIDCHYQCPYSELDENIKRVSLPLQPIYGQETQIEYANHGIKSVHCGQSYLLPIDPHTLSIGAGFYRTPIATKHNQEINKKNINNALNDFSHLGINFNDAKLSTGFSGVRCFSPDSLPIIGQAFLPQAIIDRYGDQLRKDSKYPFKPQQIADFNECLLPGIYLMTGMGARGVTSSLLAAKLLFHAINQQHWPVSIEMENALFAARFLLKALSRQDI